MRAMFEAGREVPRDVSIVGFDDVPFARYLTPPLTTVRQDFEEIGQRSVHLLLNAIHGVDDSRVRAAITPELVVRESTGPALIRPDRRAPRVVSTRSARRARLAGEPERPLLRGCPRSTRRSSRGSRRAPRCAADRRR